MLFSETCVIPSSSLEGKVQQWFVSSSGFSSSHLCYYSRVSQLEFLQRCVIVIRYLIPTNKWQFDFSIHQKKTTNWREWTTLKLKFVLKMKYIWRTIPLSQFSSPGDTLILWLWSITCREGKFYPNSFQNRQISVIRLDHIGHLSHVMPNLRN